MNDDATLKTYGNTDLRKGTEDRPLVTFAVFAYNQEKYISEAVEGAFAQTYSPLEIILSDDCSSDRTFEIMEEMASAYAGPHHVICRRSAVNRGLGLHIRDVAELSRGEIVIVAAGDDVSLARRTSAIVATMKESGAHFAASNYNEINLDGELLRANLENDYRANFIWTLVQGDPMHFANGATAGYRRAFLLGALSAAQKTIASGKLYNEDMLFSIYATATNAKLVHYTAEPLINYRINPNSLSNFRARGQWFEAEISMLTRERFWASTKLALLNAIEELCENIPALGPRVDFAQLRANRRICEVELRASDPSFLNRLRSAFSVKSVREARISLTRIGGLRLAALLRGGRAVLFRRRSR